MIHIDRKSVPVPAILKSGLAEKARNDAEKFYAVPLEKRLQKRYDFENKVRNHQEVKRALMRLFENKCAYCESLTHISEPPRGAVELFRPTGGAERGAVELFRPKTGAIGLRGDLAPDHYWWLVYEWENIYLACHPCNVVYKKNRFPVGRKRAAPGEKGEDLLKENALLIDPCLDNPDDHLLFSDDGRVAGIDQKGEVTIEVLGLNRNKLIAQRREAIESTKILLTKLSKVVNKTSDKDVKDTCEPILRRISPAYPFAGAVRHAVKRWLAIHWKKLEGIPAASELLKTIGELPSPVSAKAARKVVSRHEEKHKAQEEHLTEQSQLKTQYITRIEIHNFRIFENLILEFTFPKEREESVPWMVLLGENGMGKSSILKAVALALMDEGMYAKHGLHDASRFLPEGKRVSSGYVRVHITGFTNPFEVQFKRGDKRFHKPNKNKLQTMVFGYGGTRLPPHPKHKYVAPSGLLRVENLFDPFLPLINAESWLLSLKGRSFGYSALAIKDLLQRENDDELVRRSGKVKLKYSDVGKSYQLETLSDGYQTMIALTADIMDVVLKMWGKAEHAEGIVMIDEIDMHLHPRWKIEIVERLRRVFPRVQFIITTHDPLCLIGTRDDEVHVLSKSLTDASTTIVKKFNVPQGVTADQLLTGFWFGLPSTLDRETLGFLEEHRVLLRQGKPEHHLRRHELEDILRKRLGTFADTSVERIALSAAATVLRGDYRGPEKRDEMREKIIKKVARKVRRNGN